MRVVSRVRTRQVNIRFTNEEFEKLRAACVISGMGSISEFARAAVFRSMGLVTSPTLPSSDPFQWADLYQRSLARLETACQQIEERLERLNEHAAKGDN